MHSDFDDVQDSSDLETGGNLQGGVLSNTENASERGEHCPGTCIGSSGDPPPGQLVPSTSGPSRSAGGSGSTNTACVSRPASGDEVFELVGAFVRRGDTTVETRGAAQNEGEQVIVQPPKKKMKKSETRQPSTEIQRLRGETKRNFEKWTEGMVKTRATQIILNKISQGKTWITVTGSPGEGKTTAGYLVLKHLHSMGRQVYDIKTPEDYFKVKQAEQPVLMFNDIFGSLHFDLKKVKKWEEILCDVLEIREHKENEKIDTRNRMVTVMLISRSSVLKEASHHLGKFRDLVLKEDCVVDLTHGPSTNEKKRLTIWKSNTKGCNIDISDKVIKEVCEMSSPHGFPQCCKLFAALYLKNKHLDMEAFFFKPLEFLNQTMESLMMEGVTGPLLREMLKQNGSLNLDNIADDEKRFQYKSVVETLTGTYLSYDRGTVTFHHPSVYDSAAFVVCMKDPLFVIKHCSLSFLNERVVFGSLESETEMTTQCRVKIDNRYIETFLDRLKMEFDKDNLSLILSHQSFHFNRFVTQFMKCILPPSEVQPLSDSVRHLIHTTDKVTKESFLLLMTKSKSDKILKYVCQWVQLTQEEQMEVMFGICEHSSASSLEYFLSNHSKFDINLQNSNLQTPLWVASEQSSGSFLKLLLERNVDVSRRDSGGNSVLHNICEHGVDTECDVVKMLIDKGLSVNSECDEYPHLPLHIASYEGHRNVVIALLQCGADVNQENRSGNTPLFLSIQMGHLDVVTALLDRGADIKKTNSGGHTPLYDACHWGHVDVVTTLFDRGADINQTNSDGDTPFNDACYEGYVDVVTVLLDRGADINKTNIYGDTSLHEACDEGDVDLVTVLLDRGADINKTNSDGDTALQKAFCIWGPVDVMTVLLDRGADTNKTNNDGDTALHKAVCRQDAVNVVSLCLDRGADINIKNGKGDTPLHDACKVGHVDCVKLLLDRGADINMANNDGDTPLHKECKRGYVDFVKLLLDRGADINMTNKDGDTPLHDACYEGGVDFVTDLFDRGDVIWTNRYVDTHLHKACCEGSVGLVTVLLDRGADINKANSSGDTPLHDACKEGYVDVMKLLLDRGADINKANSNGDTPLHDACKEGYVDVVKLLLDRGADINKMNNLGETPHAVAPLWLKEEIQAVIAEWRSASQ